MYHKLFAQIYAQQGIYHWEQLMCRICIETAKRKSFDHILVYFCFQPSFLGSHGSKIDSHVKNLTSNLLFTIA